MLDASSSSLSVSRRKMADAIRMLAAQAVERAQSGHPGLPMGMADAVTVLFCNHVKQDASHPHWADRDRFILSAGHGSALLYALAYLLGHKDASLDVLKNFRAWQSKGAGHPEYGLLSCVETTTGPLGQGFANAVGMALAERWMAARFGDELVNHRTYALVGDGCLMEGLSHEAASLAGHLRLHKLMVLFDDNRVSIDGATDLTCSDDVLARFSSYGWQVLRSDGHEHASLEEVFKTAHADKSGKPVLVALRTLIGFGAQEKEGKASSHGAPLGKKEMAQLRKNLNWTHEDFDVPDDIIKAWRSIGTKGTAAHHQWQDRLNKHPLRDEFEQSLDNPLGEGWEKTIHQLKKSDGAAAATRVSSQQILEQLTIEIPCLVGGSADLTGSNGVKGSTQKIIARDAYGGNFIHYGVREMGMAAMMNGMFLHGGMRPYGGTFLVFADYARPAMRLSALMGLGVIYVMTHDSIGVGEDGPTHQPIEHLASLRAMPNLLVMRPMDRVEVAECWQLALQNNHRPSVLVLTRQKVPAIREGKNGENKSAKGAYCLRDDASARLTLLATGSEVAIALTAHDILKKEGIASRVVSMPCFELFEECASEKEKIALLGEGHKRLAIEAAADMGWHRYLDGFASAGGAFIGMKNFGASAPAEVLFEQFGINSSHAVRKAKELLEN